MHMYTVKRVKGTVVKGPLSKYHSEGKKLTRCAQYRWDMMEYEVT